MRAFYVHPVWLVVRSRTGGPAAQRKHGVVKDGASTTLRSCSLRTLVCFAPLLAMCCAPLYASHRCRSDMVKMLRARVVLRGWSQQLHCERQEAHLSMMGGFHSAARSP
jgi:hypothetical protein